MDSREKEERKRMAARLDRMFMRTCEREQAAAEGYDMTVDYTVLRAFILHGPEQWKQKVSNVLESQGEIKT